MNSDVYFAMGQTHRVCQDYATVCADGHVALADGCSTSKHTDIGARLLCRLASTRGPGEAVREAHAHLSAFRLPTSCLDATILTAGPTKDGLDIEAFMTGDGIIVGRKRGGGYTLFLSEFPSGAPRYASYDLDPARRTQYLVEFGGVHRVTRIDDGITVAVDEHEIEDADVSPFTTSFAVLDYDVVLLLSDGAMSFHRPGATSDLREHVPCTEIVKEMLNIKSFVGDFIVRRCRFFFKEAAKRGWVHDDDFSVAAIYIGDVQPPTTTAMGRP
jgi:hypothetical protein